MGRSADLNQLKTNQTNGMGRLADLKTNGMGRLDLNELKTNETKNSISTKLQEHRQAEPEPLHLRSFQSTSASTNARNDG